MENTIQEIMTKEKALQIYNMIKNDRDIERFLLATPFLENVLLSYNMKYDFFFENLYIRPEMNSDGEIVLNSDGYTMRDFVEDLEKSNKDTLFILGNKGCGKTTFVNKLMYDFKNNSNIRFTYIDAGYQAILDDNMVTAEERNNIVDALSSYLRSRIIKISKTNIPVLEYFTQMVQEVEERINDVWDKNKSMSRLFETIKDSLENAEIATYRYLLNVLDEDLNRLLIEQMLAVITLLDISEQMVVYHYQKGTTIIFDNLDNLKKVDKIDYFMSKYYTFENRISGLIDLISNKINTNIRSAYTFIFVMRDNTKAFVTQHNIDQYHIGSKEIDVTRMYLKENIVHQRSKLVIDAYETIKSEDIRISNNISEKDIVNFKRLVDQVSDIDHVLKDSYIKNTIFPFYNNDYRVCVRTLIHICRKNRGYICEYIKLMDSCESGSKYGGRGIIFKLLLDNLKRNKNFDRIRLVELTNERKNSTSLSRLILTFLSNTTDVACTTDCQKQPLNDILDNFELNTYTKDNVVECIWEMYSLIESLEWNHLLREGIKYPTL